MAVAVLTVLFGAIIAFEVPKLIKEKMWRELAVFSVMILLAVVLSFGLILDLLLINPVSALEAVFTPITQYLDGLLT
ncbi:hypothetical protein JOC37_000909 [Desulfohalotomaculum tongense]|uniref:hypothetical protein n=1 Tax=Desulforadius tongensis TaxID=1216062 RepID=UPI00195882AA|nr:hypothetical protein [Desulforadius tongensis]MBM7854536.1 hypothetical protein [Desulforadius tongensis]